MSIALMRSLIFTCVVLLVSCEDRWGGGYVPTRSMIEKWNPEFVSLLKDRVFTGLDGSYDIGFSVFSYEVGGERGAVALEEVKTVLVRHGWEVVRETQNGQAMRVLLIRVADPPRRDGTSDVIEMSPVVSCNGKVLIGVLGIDVSMPPVRQKVREDADRLYESQFAKFFEPHVRKVCGQGPVMQ